MSHPSTHIEEVARRRAVEVIVAGGPEPFDWTATCALRFAPLEPDFKALNQELGHEASVHESLVVFARAFTAETHRRIPDPRDRPAVRAAWQAAWEDARPTQ